MSTHISLSSSVYPAKLTNIAGPPKQLFVLGDMTPLSARPVVSIVGSRAVTPYGRQVTEQLARDLAAKGIAIVSGLALGVDSIAHQAALDASGYTAAVLPSSVEKVYPASHRQLAQRILDSGGALISEYAENEEMAYKQNFIARNRIVSGLADVLLITEASERSGTLHTANFALEQGKTVMVVPGNITSSNSRGTNNLIKAGALPVTDVSDILSALGISEQANAEDIVAGSPDEAAIIEALQRGISDIGELHSESGLSAEIFNQTLTMLEITGKIKPLGAGHWSLK